MKVHFSKTIGIIGGAGPMASAFLYSSIVSLCQKLYSANDYNEFPEITLISYPFTRGKKDVIQQELLNCFSRLTNADYVCIASHSFHGFLPEGPLPHGFISLVDEGLKASRHLGITRALILGAPLTIYMKLYEKSNIECVYPKEADQQIVNEIIREIAGGRIDVDQSKRLSEIIERTSLSLEFDGIIIGCTELPLALTKEAIAQKLPIVDPIQALSTRLISLVRS
ncbi:MAG: aspartate/glutamate racemase family protein [Chlamydiae bacterium]|nr:aspartate/glutamate racemase family protein [Chlamydiota bacterium]